MLRQRKGMESQSYGCLHHLFERVFCMAAELARMTVVRVRHTEEGCSMARHPEIVGRLFQALLWRDGKRECYLVRECASIRTRLVAIWKALDRGTVQRLRKRCVVGGLDQIGGVGSERRKSL